MSMLGLIAFDTSGQGAEMIREQLLNDLLLSESLSSLSQSVGDCARAMGYEHFIFSRSIGDQVLFTEMNCQEALLSGYFQCHHERIDPVSAKVRSSLLPVEWRAVSYCDTEAEPVFERTLEYGYRSGVSVPSRTPAGELNVLVLLSTRDTTRDLTAIDQAELVGLTTLTAQQMQNYCEARSGAIELTKRERECLKWTSKGKYALEVSMILGVSPSTVQFHIQNAKRKLNVTSKAEAVFKASQLGLLDRQ